MEPLNDQELQALLNTWKAPVPSEHLRPPIAQRPWYARAWTASVRVPVPVLALIVIAILAVQFIPRRKGAQAEPYTLREVRVSDFQPVPEARPVVVRRTQYENR